MKKVMYHTKDIFNFDDQDKGFKMAEKCKKKALSCGLDCIWNLNKHNDAELELYGTRWSFIKYYFKTLLLTKNVLDGILRFTSFIIT